MQVVTLPLFSSLDSAVAFSPKQMPSIAHQGSLAREPRHPVFKRTTVCLFGVHQSAGCSQSTKRIELSMEAHQSSIKTNQTVPINCD